MHEALLFFIFSSLAVADNDGNFGSCNSTRVQNSGNDAISLTLVNDWTLSNKALGLDVYFTASDAIILGADNTLKIIQAYDLTGAPTGTLDLSPFNTCCFGVAWNNNATNDTYYTNDWGNGWLFYTEDFGSTWTTSQNPAGISGRGMDFDGTNYWETNDTNVCRFNPGVGQETIPLAEPPTKLSGLTVFPNGGNTCLAVTCYSTHNIYFYDWNGSAMTYLGEAPCPVWGISSSFGLAYNDFNGNIYWSFRDGSDVYHLAEFSFSLSALSNSSWGGIKASF